MVIAFILSRYKTRAADYRHERQSGDAGQGRLRIVNVDMYELAVVIHGHDELVAKYGVGDCVTVALGRYRLGPRFAADNIAVIAGH
jgi:hypothetical protein